MTLPLPYLLSPVFYRPDVPGGKLHIYTAGTTNPTNSFAADGVTVNSNPVTLDTTGSAVVRLGGNVAYHLVLKDATDSTTIWDADNYQTSYVDGTTFVTQAAVGGALYPRTAAEILQGVTPIYYNYAPYTLLRYGADPSGVLDSSIALQQAINCAQQANYAMVRVGQPGAIFKVNSGWTIDTNKTGIDFEGAYLNASAFTSGNWLTVTQSASDVNQRGQLNAAHPIANGTWQGPGCQNTTAIAVNLFDTAGTPTLDDVSFRNIGFQDWGQDAVFGNGSFGIDFDRCLFAPTTGGTTGTATTYSINSASGTNNGERNTFRACRWSNKALLVTQNNGNADMEFHGCAFDFFNTGIVITAGVVKVFGGHMETPFDVGYWGSATGENAALILIGVTFSVDAAKSAYDMFYSDSTTTHGGVFIVNGCHLGTGANAMTTNLVGGTGNFRVRDLLQDGEGARPVLGAFGNLLAYGTFENTNYAGDWTLTNGATRSSAQAHAGTYSLSFPSSSGSNSTAVMTRPCKPGQQFQGVFWYKFPSVTSGSMTASASFNDSAGNVLSNVSIFTAAAAVNSWTQQFFEIIPVAPAGTYSVSLTFSVFGATGTQTGYIDDVVASLTE